MGGGLNLNTRTKREGVLKSACLSARGEWVTILENLCVCTIWMTPWLVSPFHLILHGTDSILT